MEGAGGDVPIRRDGLRETEVMGAGSRSSSKLPGAAQIRSAGSRGLFSQI